jgi:isorenieratene synthase
MAGLSSQILSACASRAFNSDSSQKGLFDKNKDETPRGDEWQFDAVTIYPSNAKAPPTLPKGTKRTVLVVGGGIAGLSAGIELAERGYTVTVREAAPYLGGRLHTREEKLPVGTFKVEHGLHMWFYQYYNFLELLGKGRLDVLDKYFVDFKEVFFIFKEKEYKPELLKSVGPYPFNLLGIVLSSPNLNILSAVGTAGALPDILAYDFSRVYKDHDDITLVDYARKRMVNKDFYNVVMEPAASVTLNDPDKVSAAEMLTFMQLYFLGHPKAFWRKVTTVDHGTAVIEPMAERVRKFGGTVVTSAPVKGLRFEGGKVAGCVGESETYDQVILACDIPGTKKILEASTADSGTARSLKELRDGVAEMKIAPLYHILRVWFDKPTDPARPFNQACIETPRSTIHLIGIFSMLEKECIDWAKKTGGSVVEYHLYNAPKNPGLTKPNLTAAEAWEVIKGEADAILPELQGANTLAMTLGSFENFTSYEVGQATARLDPLSARGVGVANLGLAGDWIRTPYPSALMERAVCTGRECANVILAEDNVRKVTLRVPREKGPGLLPKF